MSADRRKWVPITILILTAHNLVQNSVLNERGYVSGNLVVSGLLVGVGRAAGLGWDEMGFAAGDTRKSLRIGAGAAVASAAIMVVALGRPRTQRLLQDERASIGSPRDIARRALLRFPLGTAMFEEVAFRGVLPALLRRSHRPGSAEMGSAIAFGLWHLIPTHRALEGNPIGRGKSSAQRAMVTVIGATAAGVAGLALGWTRRATGNLLAPWLVHTSLNTLSYLAAVTANRRRR
jgi:membrane protease YdiL (CAAX protease family)